MNTVPGANPVGVVPLTTPNGIAPGGRFRLNRAGILNVWQYDAQEFAFGGGRLLLRGANGAGKSKTLEMLLPFALDGDKARLTASAKHHTSLLWLMTDGYDGPGRVGYVWVEFLRTDAHGVEESFTCGVGIRASASQRSANAWHFATSRRIGIDVSLEADGSPLSRGQLAEVLGDDGYVFERAAPYKEHIGRTLFGLEPAAYDDVLRLLYWLRQPQIGEDIEPAKLTAQLSQALPQIDEQALRVAGETFDELVSFGEQIERRAGAAKVLGVLAEAYADYARAVVADRARAVQEALRTERQLRSNAKRAHQAVERLAAELAAADGERDAERAAIGQDEARLRTLKDSPEFRSQRRLVELEQRAERDRKQADEAASRRDRADDVVHKRDEKVKNRAVSAGGLVNRLVSQLRALHTRLRTAVPASPGLVVGVALELGELSRIDQVAPISAALDHATDLLTHARSAVSLRLAAVAVVREALAEADRAAAAQHEADRAADEAERRWEAARARLREAEGAAEDAAADFTARVSEWTAQAPNPVEVALPDEWDAEAVEQLPLLAQAAAAPTLDAWRDDRARAASRRDNAQARIDELRTRRAEVAAERDPAPPRPALPRTDRSDGLALWQVVDFAEGVGDAERAGVEAALQASGLLDAWLRPGGRLLDREHRDVVLVGVTQSDDGQVGRNDGVHTLARFLTPDLPDGCDLSVDDVRRVLAAIGAGQGLGAGAEAGEGRNSGAIDGHSDGDEDGDGAAAGAGGQADEASGSTAWVHPDGSWRLGPAFGRAAKHTAQYIGATARAQERLRRLAEIDAELAEQEAQRDAAVAEFESAQAALVALTAWVQAAPPGRLLLEAWTRADERRSEEARAGDDNQAAQATARAARTAAAEARSRHHRAAAEHDLPTALGDLDAAEQGLRALDNDLAGAEREVPAIRTGLAAWEEATADWQEAVDALAHEREAAATAAQRAAESAAEADALRATVGASIDQLNQAIAQAERSRVAHEHAARDAEQRANTLRGQHGGALADANNADGRLVEHLHTRAVTIAALAATAGVPGLLAATGAPPEQCDEVTRLTEHPAEEAVGTPTAAAVQALGAMSDAEPVAAQNRVWKAHSEATSGPAADHQPAVAEYADLLAVSGRDEAGEASIVELATRVDAGVRRDRELLTEREKKQFEQHILGELGDAIRRCSREADELVMAMNQQLNRVTTSQGIRVKLDWKLRDNVPTEAREAVQLLAQPVGALTATERVRLRDALHQLIEQSRAERPELSYSEHLTAALDYRVWSEFTIRYNRPEAESTWERLHRRSPLSQGEQKVLCYLPLFAAAAAHFTSLAGAAPHAPRLVLLDDAFPKIDVRTHPLLFGLLVQLDLDFVITSERLWGDHDTVPSLAIYEALRDPGQRGIAQYEYRWDGRALHSVG